MMTTLALTTALASAAGAMPPFGHGLRPYFFFPANVTQLNHGAYGGTTRSVVAAQYDYVAAMEADLDNFMNDASGYRACIADAKGYLAAMIGANVNDTVLVDNASEAVNDILRNLEPPLSADEWIIDLSTAYVPFTGLYGWLQERQGVQTLTVPITWPVTGPESFLEPVRAVLAANATSLNVRVAVISQISAYPAVTLPVAELVALFRAHGIPVVVDGAHALGNIDVNVAAMGDPDYAFWNLHKWMYAPKSSALLYVRRDRQLPHVPAPSVVDNVETQAFPDRFVWTGTRDRTAFCAIRPAIAFRDSIGGEAAIQAYNHGLALYAASHLGALWGVAPMAPTSMISSLCNVQIPTANATACAYLRSTLISEYGMSVSGWTDVPGWGATHPCFFRISGQVYLETADVDRLGALTVQILKGFEGGAHYTGPA